MQKIFIGMALLASSSLSLAETSAPVSDTIVAKARQICIMEGTPPAGTEFTMVRKLRVAKGTYGNPDYLTPKLVAAAKKTGANAVINVSGKQRFGFWPWRIVRPVMDGTAIKWDKPESVDCVALGGKLL